MEWGGRCAAEYITDGNLKDDGVKCCDQEHVLSFRGFYTMERELDRILLSIFYYVMSKCRKTGNDKNKMKRDKLYL